MFTFQIKGQLYQKVSFYNSQCFRWGQTCHSASTHSCLIEFTCVVFKFTFAFVWVQNVLAYIKAVSYIADVWGQSIEETILIQDSGSSRRMEINDLYVVHNCILHQLLLRLSERGWLHVQVWQEIRNVFKIWRKTNGKRWLGRPGHGREDIHLKK